MAKKQTQAPAAADQAATQAAQKQPETAEKQPENGGNSETKPEDLPAAADTVRVKFLRSHPALAYHPGEEADLPKELYDKYLEAGPFFQAID